MLNERRADRAIAAGCDELTCVMVASETFSQHNQEQTTAEGLAAWARVAKLACEAEPDEMALADTIGVGTPAQVSLLFTELQANALPLRVHLHNTRNTGHANAHAAILAGVSILDSSAGGISGLISTHSSSVRLLG